MREKERNEKGQTLSIYSRSQALYNESLHKSLACMYAERGGLRKLNGRALPKESEIFL